MQITHNILTIFAVMVGTMFTRFLPFIIFPNNKKPPEFIIYLGKVLPYASMGLLIVYSVKDAAFVAPLYGLPEFLAIALVTILHKIKRNILLSIGAGTVFYMFLVQYIFI